MRPISSILFASMFIFILNRHDIEHQKIDFTEKVFYDRIKGFQLFKSYPDGANIVIANIKDRKPVQEFKRVWGRTNRRILTKVLELL